MADSSTILREYLVALGFQNDEVGERKMGGALTNMDKRATALTKGLIGVATAAQTMATVFAFQMEKLYYAAKRGETTVGSIQALDYAFRQAGGSGGQMQAAMENMARAMRMNPGLQPLLESLGVKVTGRDKADVLQDLVTQLNKMPFFVASQYANLFGIDPDTLLMLGQSIDKVKELTAARRKMAEEAGVDTEKAAAASKAYAEALRETWERVGLLKDAISIRLLPSMLEFARVTNLLLTDFTQLVNRFTSFKDLGEKFWDGIAGTPQKGGGVVLSEESRRRLGSAGTDPYKGQTWWERMMEAKRRAFGGSPTQAPTQAPNASPGASPQAPAASTPAPSGPEQSMAARQAHLAALERKYGLPPGWLDRVWKKESNRGDPRFMRSKAGAEGHFQFMPDAAKDYGLKNPYDFNESADAAARYFANLSKKYKGDPAKMAAGYNWGPGNVDKYGLGKAPAETRGYIDAVAGPAITQQNYISIQGVSDPSKAADFVIQGQEQANANLVRDFKPRVQ